MWLWLTFTSLVVQLPAPVVMVEAGSRTSLGRHLCALKGDARITLSEGRLVVPTHAEFSRVDIESGDCTHPDVFTVYVVPPVTRSPTAAWLHVDEGRLELKGGPLARAVIWWRFDEEPWVGSICLDTPPGEETAASCDVEVPESVDKRVLSGQRPTVLRLPPGAPMPTNATLEPEVWVAGKGATNDPLPLDSLRAPLARVVVSPPTVKAASIEAWRDQVNLPLAHPGSVASVHCRPANCWLAEDGHSIAVMPASAGDTVTLNVRLKDKVVLRQGDDFVGSTSVSLPLARCQLRPLVKELLGGTSEHRVPIALGERCPTDLTGIVVDSTPPASGYLALDESDSRRVEVRLGRVSDRVETLELRLLRGSTRTVIGSARFSVRSSHTPIHIELLDADLGPLPVVPTNREVQLTWASADVNLGPRLFPVEIPGYYQLRQEDGKIYIRGTLSTSGTIPLRFAYLSPDPDETEPLATFDSDVHFPIRAVNVPVSLTPDDPNTGRLFSVYCREGTGDREVLTGDLMPFPYASRSSCWLRIDRRVLTAAEGTQRIRLAVDFASPTGSPRPGGYSRTLVLSQSSTIETVWLNTHSTLRPFDHMTVQLAHDDQPGHYVSEGEASGLPARGYQMIFGDERLRLYGSATVPTGLFRITKGKGGGVLQFSGGVLVRLVGLDPEGREYPFDLEFGLLGTNLSDEADLSVVLGPGITVPLLNPNETAKASIGVHAWLEYAPTRAKTSREPFAFVFGPSISFGDFGTNL